MTLKNQKLKSGKKIYFASDFHLGMPNWSDSLIREKKIVKWLSRIAGDAQHVVLLGDLFDFWFEYRHVAPKGYVRLLGKLAELSDAGIKLTIFTGNHDLWLADYLSKELDAEIVRKPISLEVGKKKFFLAHGDEFHITSVKSRLIKWLFQNKLCQWLFGWLHPTISFSLARFWSAKSRNGFQRNEAEAQILLDYSSKMESSDHHDFYIFGDCHVPMSSSINEKSTYINLGDWVKNFSYAEYDGEEVHLRFYDG